MNVKKILPLLLAAAPVCGGYAAVTSDSLFVYSPGERDGAHVAIVSNGTVMEVGQTTRIVWTVVSRLTFHTH